MEGGSDGLGERAWGGTRPHAACCAPTTITAARSRRCRTRDRGRGEGGGASDGAGSEQGGSLHRLKWVGGHARALGLNKLFFASFF